MNDTIYPLNDTSLAAHRAGWSLQRLSPHVKEAIYQTVIVFVLMIFFSFSLDGSQHQSLQSLFKPSKLAFFANYLAAAMIINYVLLPMFYYRKRMLLFVAALAVLITLVIMVDEYVLEQIFFPDTRGTYFPGLAFTLVETLPIIIIMVAFKLAWDSNHKQRELERLKSLMKESEIEFLKSQINPHFLFNNLNTLYAYAIDRSPKTPSIILELSAVLRYMLYECKTDFVALTTEIQHLENYVALNQLQIGERGKIRFSKEIEHLTFTIPPMVLIVFVENAFKHSAGSQAGNIDIDVQVRVSEQGLLTFSCRNNYSQHYPSSGLAKGIGLENVKKRLDLQFRSEHTLDIQDNGQLFAIELTMRLKKLGEA
ncbi:histidine kinase [Chitinophaga horti]|uniref:Histidine kinase n=1 Tax=Chitinophaga horti TaxID=2920382 RepID=A0ABY6J7F2_9BACT|nr:histidine kinase [Chitinophaga horti]UYQ95614.1 histidine kinase [Chitinophaga horti]